MPETVDSGSAVSPAASPNAAGGAQNAQPNSPFDAKAIAAALLPEIEPLLDRKFQSFKDRTFGQQNKRLEAVEKLAGVFTKGGVAPEDAKAYADRLIPTEPKAEPPAPGPQGAGTSPTLADAERSVLTAAGLKEDDPDVVAIQTNQKDEGKRYAEYLKLVGRRNAPANPAGMPPMRGTTSNVDQTDAYKREMLANRGKGMAVAEQIKAKYRALDVDVDAISLIR